MSQQPADLRFRSSKKRIRRIRLSKAHRWQLALITLLSLAAIALGGWIASAYE